MLRLLLLEVVVGWSLMGLITTIVRGLRRRCVVLERGARREGRTRKENDESVSRFKGSKL